MYEEYHKHVCATLGSGDKSIGEETGRACEGASETTAGSSSVGKGVESNAAPIGAGTPIRTTSAHYRPTAGREKVPREFPPLLTRLALSSTRLCLCRSRENSLVVPAVGEGRSPLRFRSSHRGREEEPPHGLSLRVAALQHSRLPRPFRGAGTPRSIYTHVTHAHVSTDHPYTRGRRVHTALNPDGDFSTPTPPREVWG